ncbi:MAG TPA: hypothetical protein VFV93_09330 [Thermomicrobiales bacterium]|nr:hypothetical protein [Thermomicrobiales bacterium]
MDDQRPNNTDPGQEPENLDNEAVGGTSEPAGEDIAPDAQPTQPLATPPSTPPGAPPPSDNDGRQRWIIGGVLAFVLVAALLALLLFRDDDDGDDTEAEEQATEEVATETAMAAIEPTATVVEPTATSEPEPTETEVQATETPEPDDEETEVAATETAEAEPEPTETKTAPTETAEAAEPTATKTPEEAKPTEEPKPTATEEEPEPTPDDSDLAYEADWSTGNNGWVLTSGWAIENGNLVTSGNAAPLTAPFESQRADYAVEMTMTVTDLDDCDARVGVFARVTDAAGPSGTVHVGYPASVCDDAWHIDSVLADDRDSLASGDRPLASGSHDYRIEVAGERIRLYIDDEFVGAATDNRWTEAGRGGIYVDGDAQVQISAFRIFLLSDTP